MGWGGGFLVPGNVSTKSQKSWRRKGNPRELGLLAPQAKILKVLAWFLTISSHFWAHFPFRIHWFCLVSDLRIFFRRQVHIPRIDQNDGLWDSCIFGARFGGRFWTHKPLCICYSSRLVYFSAVTKNILGLTPNWARSRDFMSPELFPRSSFQIQHEKTQWRGIDEQWQRSIEPRFRKSSDRKTFLCRTITISERNPIKTDWSRVVQTVKPCKDCSADILPLSFGSYEHDRDHAFRDFGLFLTQKLQSFQRWRPRIVAWKNGYRVEKG